MNHNDIKRMVLFAVMTAAAVILHFVEGMFPLPIAVPGIKLGLPNILSLAALYLFGPYAAFSVLILRVLMTSFLYGGFSNMIFSLSGGILSVAVMSLFWKFRDKGFSIVSASVAGGVFHNIGQILAAMLVLRTSTVLSYLPVLIVSGVVTGVVTGTVAGIVVPRLAGIYSINK